MANEFVFCLIAWAVFAAAWWAWYKFRNWEDRIADARADARAREEYRRRKAEAEIADLERLERARKRWFGEAVA